MTKLEVLADKERAMSEMEISTVRKVKFLLNDASRDLRTAFNPTDLIIFRLHIAHESITELVNERLIFDLEIIVFALCC